MDALVKRRQEAVVKLRGNRVSTTLNYRVVEIHQAGGRRGQGRPGRNYFLTHLQLSTQHYMNTLEWLEYSAIGEIVRQVYPWIEVVHILGFSLLFGSITIFDLRLLGYCRHLSIADAVRYFLRLAQVSFLAVAISGFLLFAAQPTILVANIAFRLKLSLLAIAGLNAAVFHWHFSPYFKRWRKTNRRNIFTVIAILSLIIWTGIMICGRLIAYA
jgi:hypothetical protein